MAAKKAAAKTPPKPPAKKAAPRKRAPAKKTTAATPPGPPEKGTEGSGQPAEKSGAPAGRQPVGGPQRGPSGPPGFAQKNLTSLAKQVAKPKPGKSYHRIVLGEFVVCVVLIFTGSIVKPKVKDGAYVFVHVLVQLTAVCAVFFVLALLGSAKTTGKLAAAFGFLITLGVLLNSTGAIIELGKIFGLKPSKTDQQAG